MDYGLLIYGLGGIESRDGGMCMYVDVQLRLSLLFDRLSLVVLQVLCSPFAPARALRAPRLALLDGRSRQMHLLLVQGVCRGL